MANRAGMNIHSKRDGDVDFVFLVRDTAAPSVDNRPERLRRATWRRRRR
jgi:hypothetical protein